MKNRNFLKNSIALLLPISMGIGVLFGVQSKSITQVQAYESSSLPTTIDLKPTSESTIRSYYNAVSGKKSNDLLKALKPVLMNGQKYYSYDSGDAVWKMYEITDRDWEKSPASEINGTYGTYNSSTNTITGYKYGSNSDPKSNPYVRALYTNRDADNPKRAWGSHGKRAEAETIEREHIWPKSHGFDSGTVAGARGDPMHLWAADGTANGMHSNLFYGNVDKTKTYKDAGNTHNILWGNLTGTSKTIGSGTVFEPQDSDKGDIARACFYMVARYNNLAKNDNNISGANPNLTLSTNLSENDRTGTSTSSDSYSLGLLQDLLEWNKLDPVDDYEIKRNDILYTNFTNNRNPFIDFPEWADIIWGGESNTANPTSDPLHGGSVTPSGKILRNIEITTQPTKTTYSVGESFNTAGMVVTANYSDGSSEAVTGYTLSKTSNLQVADKRITITYQGKTTTVNVTVNPSSGGGETTYTWDLVTDTAGLVTGDEYVIAANGYDVAMSTTQNENNRGKASITKQDNKIESPNEDVQIFTLEAGTTSGTYAFSIGTGYIYAAGSGSGKNNLRTEESLSANSSWFISISDNLASIVAQGSNTNNVLQYNTSGSGLFSCYSSASQKAVSLYHKVAHGGSVVHPTGVTLDKTSLELETGSQTTLVAAVLPNNVSDNSIVWSSSSDAVATVDEFGQVTAVAPGTAVITAAAHDTLGGYAATCTVTVPQPIILSSLTVSGNYKTAYYIGDAFTTEDIAVTANYTQGGQPYQSVDVTSECEFDGFDSETSGAKTITVTYGEATTTFNVTVSEIPVEPNTVKFIASQFGLDNSQTVGEISKDDYTISFSSNATKYYDSGSAIRVYGGNSFIISGPKKIVGVTFVFANYASTNTFSVDHGTCNAQTGAWSSDTGVPSLTYTLSGTSGQQRIQQIIVRYDPDQSAYAPLASIALSGNYKQDFAKSDTFTAQGLVVTAIYEDGVTRTVTPTSVEGANLAATGAQQITVSYTENSITKTATYMIFVRASSASETTITKTISELVTENGWAVSSGNNVNGCYTSFTLDSNVTVSTSGEPNCGSVWGTSPNNDWRLYRGNKGDLTISVGEGYKIVSVKVSFTVGNSGTLLNGDTKVSSNEVVAVDNTTITFTVGGGETGKTNGQVKVTSISVTYSGASSLFTGISLSGEYQTEFALGDTFSSEGLVVTASYSDEVTHDVTAAAIIEAPDMTTKGDKTVNVKYNGATESYTIHIGDPVVMKDYTISGGEFFEGRYAIGSIRNEANHSFYIMKAAISNSRFTYDEVTAVDGKISVNSLTDEWIIQKNGEFYTLFNTYTNCYAASTGAANQGALQEVVDDKALWSFVKTPNADTVEFINKYNNQNGVNAKLQTYGSNGFAAYNYNKTLTLFRLDSTSFVKATDTSQLVEGAKITLLGKDKDSDLFAMNDVNNKLMPGESFSWSTNNFFYTTNREMLTFTIRRVNDVFCLERNGKYLTNPTSNDIAWSDAPTNGAVEVVTVSGNLALKVGDKYLKFNFISGTPVFKFYAQSTGLFPEIYVDRNFGEAAAWSSEFLNGTYDCHVNDWNSYKALFAKLSVSSQSKVTGATANQFGSLEEQAAARYDYIVSDSRYTVDSFMSTRKVTSSKKNTIALFNAKNNLTIFIVIFALIGLTSIGAYIYVKRRKEADI